MQGFVPKIIIFLITVFDILKRNSDKIFLMFMRFKSEVFDDVFMQGKWDVLLFVVWISVWKWWEMLREIKADFWALAKDLSCGCCIFARSSKILAYWYYHFKKEITLRDLFYLVDTVRFVTSRYDTIRSDTEDFCGRFCDLQLTGPPYLNWNK